MSPVTDHHHPVTCHHLPFTNLPHRSSHDHYPQLALIGFGTVGQGLAEILLAKGDELAARYGVQFQVVAVSDLLKGSLYNHAGLDLAALLDVVRRTGKLHDYALRQPSRALFSGWDSLRTIRDSNADTVVEISWTDVQTGQPAIDHVKAAFESGKHAVLTNKGPVALAYRELAELAAAKGVQFRFEGTVMSGTPTIRLAQSALAGCEITEIKGILNGTTNYILTQMEGGQSYADALAEAQRLGYAEADPTADVEGWDAAGKTVILANVLLGGDLARGRRGPHRHQRPDPGRRGGGQGGRRALETDRARLARGRPRPGPASNPPACRSAIPWPASPARSTPAPTPPTCWATSPWSAPAQGGMETGYAVLGDLLDIAA